MASFRHTYKKKKKKTLTLCTKDKHVNESLWRNQKFANMIFVDKLVDFFDQETLTDVELKTVDGTTIKAHKVVLAARSRFVCDKISRR